MSSHAQFTCSYIPKFGHETTTNVLDCTVNMLGWGCYSHDVRADITVQIYKLAELAKQKQNQEINKIGTLSHGVPEVTILHKAMTYNILVSEIPLDHAGER